MSYDKNMMGGMGKMSWEEISRNSCKCPCGNGTVEEIIYMDDWNGIKSKYEIRCEKCAENYYVEEISYSKGEIIYSSHYCVRNNYPFFYCLKNDSHADFADYLASYFSLNLLVRMSHDIEGLKYSKEISKNDCLLIGLVKEARKQIHTIKLDDIRKNLLKAIDGYEERYINYDKLQAQEERHNAYSKEKAMASFELDFNNK